MKSILLGPLQRFPSFSALLVCLLFILPFAADTLLAQDPAATPLTDGPAVSTAEYAGRVPPLIRFNGTLRDNVGVSKNQTAQLALGIFETQEGGAPLWTEAHEIHTDSSGKYSVLLGSRSGGVPIELFRSMSSMWIGAVSDNSKMGRIRFISVPYALKASDAETLAGHLISDFVLKDRTSNASDSAYPIPGCEGLLCTPWKSPVIAPSFLSTNSIGPSFISSASSGPPLEILSKDLVRNLNADMLHGLPPLAFAQLAKSSVFVAPQLFKGGVVLPPTGTASKTHPNGEPSSGLDFRTSSLNSTSQETQEPYFRWQAEPIGSNTDSPTARLSLLFSQGTPATPVETGFSFGHDGTMTFASGQQIPLPSIQTALQDAGLVGADNPGLPPAVLTSLYRWTQTPTKLRGITVGRNTVTLRPCPRGVNGSDQWHFLYISGTGTPESVLISGGTCISGAETGTIEFSAVYSHAAGFSITSATSGIQEAVNAAIVPGTGAIRTRNVVVDTGNYLFHARLSIRASNMTLSGSASTIVCQVQDTCIMVGDPVDITAFQGVTLSGLRMVPGIPAGTWPAIEDNAQGTQMNGIAAGYNPSPVLSFGHLIQIDSDLSSTIDKLDTSQSWGRCDASFCSSAIYGSGSPGVIWVRNSNLTLNCRANGIDNHNGNTLHVFDTVVEGYPQFGIRSFGGYTVNPTLQWTNDFEEVGNCINPLGTGTAGVIVVNGYASKSGGVGPDAKLPIYAQTGTIQYGYYIVVHSSILGVSPPYLAGVAFTSGSGAIPVVWNRVGSTGVITYDVLRIVGNLAAFQSAPYASGNFAVITGVTTAACDHDVCKVVDDASADPSSYSVPGGAVVKYAPALLLWPGGVILTTATDQGAEQAPARYFTDTITGSAGGIVNSGGALVPTVFAQECDAMGHWSPLWAQCVAGDSTSYNFAPIGATVLQSATIGGQGGGLKGRLIFEAPPDATITPNHMITILDSNPDKTLATPGNRATWDDADSYIGFDNPRALPRLQAQMSFGSNVSISHYIANRGDNIHWLERLTAALKTFQVPVAAPSYQTTSNCKSLGGSCGSAAAGMAFIPAGSTSITVTTSAVGPYSEIHLDENLSYGPLLGISCDNAWGRHYRINQQAIGSFMIETDSAPSLGSACLGFSVIN